MCLLSLTGLHFTFKVCVCLCAFGCIGGLHNHVSGSSQCKYSLTCPRTFTNRYLVKWKSEIWKMSDNLSLIWCSKRGKCVPCEGGDTVPPCLLLQGSPYMVNYVSQDYILGPIRSLAGYDVTAKTPAIQRFNSPPLCRERTGVIPVVTSPWLHRQHSAQQLNNQRVTEHQPCVSCVCVCVAQ